MTDHLATQAPKRLIVVSRVGTGWSEQDDSLPGHVLRVKVVSDAHLQASQSDDTIVRPGGLTNKQVNGQGSVGMLVQDVMIAREDVAAMVVAFLIDAGSVGRPPGWWRAGSPFPKQFNDCEWGSANQPGYSRDLNTQI